MGNKTGEKKFEKSRESYCKKIEWVTILVKKKPYSVGHFVKKKYLTDDMWHMTVVMWDVTCDTWNMTGGGGEPSLKC